MIGGRCQNVEAGCRANFIDLGYSKGSAHRPIRPSRTYLLSRPGSFLKLQPEDDLHDEPSRP